MFKTSCYALLVILALSIRTAREMPTVNSGDLEKTFISPVLEVEIIPGQNLIYCATFQLAWNGLRDSFPSHQNDDPEIIKLLDKKMFTKKDLSEDCYVSMCGKWKKVHKKINSLLKKKFGNEAWLLTKERVLENRFSEDALIAYAFLFKNLLFEEMFESLKNPILFNGSDGTVEIEGFGIKEFTPNKEKDQRLSKQVSIYYYNFDREAITTEFVLELKSQSSDDEIIIAQVIPQATLFETVKGVQEIIAKNEPSSLREHETLQIPKFNFDIDHLFPDIENYLSSLVAGPAKAYQRIKFKLDERGAILKSEAIIATEGMYPIIRSFVVSEPFLVYLKQNDSPYPYFAIWIDNEEILIKNHQ